MGGVITVSSGRLGGKYSVGWLAFSNKRFLDRSVIWIHVGQMQVIRGGDFKSLPCNFIGLSVWDQYKEYVSSSDVKFFHTSSLCRWISPSDCSNCTPYWPLFCQHQKRFAFATRLTRLHSVGWQTLSFHLNIPWNDNRQCQKGTCKVDYSIKKIGMVRVNLSLWYTIY